MKNMLRKVILGLLLSSLLGGAAFAEGRLATIDLRKVFDGYWKKKQAEAALKERQADMEKEDKNMIEDYKRVKDEFTALQASASETAISADEREKRKKAAEDKLKQVKDLEETITQYERQARTTISEQSQRMRSNILGEIRAVVSAKAKSGNFSMVIDTAADSVNNTPVLLFSNGENDITDAVLTQLNAGAPAETKSDEAATDKKDSKN